MNKKYTLQTTPFTVPTNDGKEILEYFGKASTAESGISIAHMIAPPGWSEPAQRPDFEEYTIILKGRKQFLIEGEKLILEAGQAIKIERNVRIQYSNPFEEACEYLAICLPAFSMERVNRET